jgi:hypothetical protein
LRGRVNHSFDIHSFNSFLCLLRGSVFVSRRGSVDILILFHSHRHYLIPPYLLFHSLSAQYIIFSVSSPCPSLISARRSRVGASHGIGSSPSRSLSLSCSGPQKRGWPAWGTCMGCEEGSDWNCDLCGIKMWVRGTGT